MVKSVDPYSSTQIGKGNPIFYIYYYYLNVQDTYTRPVSLVFSK